MEYVRLGKTGVQVSRLTLGMMSYGDAGWRDWVLSEQDAAPIISRALELGITTFDTADVYSEGASEELLGRLVLQRARRDEVVVATKVYFKHGDYANAGGLSRKHIFDSIDGSLRRLGTDYVDLYQIHRWDSRTPIEETMEALNDVVRAGKARYIGASSMYAWQFAKAQRVAGMAGWTEFVSMQPHYNLLHREDEAEMLPQCADMGVGVLPWSPVARGVLARPWSSQVTTRGKSDWLIGRLYDDQDAPMVDAVETIAGKHGASMAQVALAWLLTRPVVTSPIIGAPKMAYLEDAVAALDLALTDEDLDLLDSAHQSRARYGPRGDRKPTRRAAAAT